MARGRMISKSLSTSEKFAALVTVAGELSEFCQALYPLVVVHSDDFGRLQGDTFTIKHMCFPSSPRSADEFSTAVGHLHDVGLIIRYEVAGKRYIQIENFEPHQIGLHKRTRSRFPRVPETSGLFPETPDQLKGTELKRTELNGSSDLFDRFWDAYPRKVGKDDARKAFSRRKPDDALLALMLTAIDQQRRSPGWMKDGGEFIPHPATWLNKGRWQDEVTAPTARQMGIGGSTPADWTCPHQPHCLNPRSCDQKINLAIAKKRAS